jgi:hypothetical protein
MAAEKIQGQAPKHPARKCRDYLVAARVGEDLRYAIRVEADKQDLKIADVVRRVLRSVLMPPAA